MRDHTGCRAAGALLLVLTVLALTACGGPAAIPAAAPAAVLDTAPDEPAPTPAAAESGSATPAATAEAAAPAAGEEVEPPAEPTRHPDRPAAPAAVDAGFRSDPATVVGATGRPQLLEFFTHW